MLSLKSFPVVVLLFFAWGSILAQDRESTSQPSAPVEPRAKLPSMYAPPGQYVPTVESVGATALAAQARTRAAEAQKVRGNTTFRDPIGPIIGIVLLVGAVAVAFKFVRYSARENRWEAAAVATASTLDDPADVGERAEDMGVLFAKAFADPNTSESDRIRVQEAAVALFDRLEFLSGRPHGPAVRTALRMQLLKGVRNVARAGLL